MIKIIKHGNSSKEFTCKHCQCVFEASYLDLKKNCFYFYTYCPECGAYCCNYNFENNIEHLLPNSSYIENIDKFLKLYDTEYIKIFLDDDTKKKFPNFSFS